MSQVGTGGGSQLYPSISGSVVVWQEQSSPTDLTRVCGTHLGTGDWFVVPLPNIAMTTPVVAGHLVVFGFFNDVNDDTGADVYSADLSKLQTQAGSQICYSWRPVCTQSGDQGLPWTDGKTIVWTDGHVNGCSVADYHEFSICHAPGDQENAEVDGDLVVWQDNRNGDWDIYGYSLSRHVEFPICVAPGDQTLPCVSISTVVWVDSRGGGTIRTATVRWPN
jgi:beta propeller repeat protein